MIDFVADNFYYVFLAWLVLNLIQRKQRARGNKKRNATLFQAILIFILYIGATVIREEGFEEKWIMVPLALIAALIYFFRDRIFPYKNKCVSCGAKLDMNQIFLFDNNMCKNCDPYEQEEEDSAEEDEDNDEDSDSEEKALEEGTEESAAADSEVSGDEQK